jgi:hypothetical protein
MKIQLSEYFGENNGRRAEVHREGNWFVAKLFQDEKVVDHESSFKEELVEVAAKDWVNDTI